MGFHRRLTYDCICVLIIVYSVLVHAFLCRFQSTLIFFFQAEDGIRDGHVTGVQTCALPISAAVGAAAPAVAASGAVGCAGPDGGDEPGGAGEGSGGLEESASVGPSGGVGDHL